MRLITRCLSFFKPCMWLASARATSVAGAGAAGVDGAPCLLPRRYPRQSAMSFAGVHVRRRSGWRPDPVCTGSSCRTSVALDRVMKVSEWDEKHSELDLR